MSKRKAALPFIFAVLVIDVLGVGIVIPVLPRLVAHLHGGDLSSFSTVYGFIVASYAAMQFLFAPILGNLSDRFGRRPVLLLSVAGLGLDFLVQAYAPSLSWLVAARLLSGALGASFTTAIAYIADVTSKEDRAKSFGLVGAAFGLGFIVGPALGGWLGSIDVRLPFKAAAALSLANFAYGLFVLPESLPKELRRPFSLAKANPLGSVMELRRFPEVLGLVGTFVLANLAHRGLESTWVLYVGNRYGWGPADTGWSLAAVGVTEALVQGLLVGWAVKRLGGERRAVIVGLSLSALDFLSIGVAWQGWMVYALLPLGAASGIGVPALQGLMSRDVPPDEQGLLQGALTSLASLTGIVGPPVMTGLFGVFAGPSAPFTLPGAAFFLCALLQVAGMLLARRTFLRVTKER